MKVKALTNFVGTFSMHEGEIKECSNKVILQDLLNCGYVEKVKIEKEKENIEVVKVDEG